MSNGEIIKPNETCSKCVNINSNINLSKTSRNIFLNNLYRPPHSGFKNFQIYSKEFLSEVEKSNKNIILPSDFNIKVLDSDSNRKVQNFLNLNVRS